MANTTIPSELIADGAITSAKLDTNIAVGGTLNVSGAVTGSTLNIGAEGSIGVVSTDRLYIATADGLGLQFDKDNNRIVPVAADGATYNNNVELGDSGLEFTNLWLSGTLNGISTTKSVSGNRWGVLPEVESNGVMEIGRYLDFHSTDGDTSDYGARLDFDGTNIVSTNAFRMASGIYLGGTAAANKLDDYEEGTWTPSFSTGSWGTVANFTYTKIGRLVHVTGYLAGPSNAPAGNLIISGFPFPGNDNYNMVPLWYAGSASTAAYAYMAANQTSITVRPVTGGVNTMSELSVQMVYTTT